MVNYLKEVIVRIDIPSGLDCVNKEIPIDLKKEILKNFPILEPKTIDLKEFEVTPKKEFKQKDITAKEWFFFGKLREKTLVVAEKVIWIRYLQYQSFSILKQDFLPVIDELFKCFPNIQINRMGLRYINNINLNSIDKSDWKYKIDNSLLHNFNLKMFDSNTARVFSIVDKTYDDMKFHFQFGIANPDFPAPIKNKEFILDYDAYFEGILNKNDIYQKLDLFKSKISQSFKQSIK